MAYRSTFVKSIQRGTITLNNVTSNTATVTSVDMATSVLHCLGWSSAGTTTDLRPFMMALVLTNATTITATVNTAAVANHIVSYELVEYYVGIIKSIQRGTITSTTATTATATITSVNTAKSHVIGGNATVNDATAMQENVTSGRLDLTNATTVTFTKAAALGTWTIPFTVVEWY